MSMASIGGSIASLLNLERPLPRSLADELRLGNRALLKLNDDFTDISSELRIWTFYETIDSQLSGLGYGFIGEVQFGAPLVSIKSSLLGVKQEAVFAVESDHANCASFGMKNPRTLTVFLSELSEAVAKAEELSDLYTHHPLKLKEHVKIELVGFYDDFNSELEARNRLYSTKYHFQEFMIKGPERCLEERLSKTSTRRGSTLWQDTSNTAMRRRRNSTSSILPDVPKPAKKVKSPSIGQATGVASQPPATATSSNIDILITSPSHRPSVPDPATVSSPTQSSSSSPAPRRKRIQSLTVPSLATPHYHRPASRAGSEGSASTMSEPVEDLSPTDLDDAEIEVTLPAGTARQSDKRDTSPGRKGRLDRQRTVTIVHDLSASNPRPDPSYRKFMWIHLPFTNPLWVKVCCQQAILRNS
jgi:hypothetical protein